MVRLSGSKQLGQDWVWELSRCGMQLAQTLPAPRAWKPTLSLTTPSLYLAEVSKLSLGDRQCV